MPVPNFDELQELLNAPALGEGSEYPPEKGKGPPPLHELPDLRSPGVSEGEVAHQIQGNEWAESGKWAVVNTVSTNINAIAYDKKNKILFVNFTRTGRTAAYKEIGIDDAINFYNVPTWTAQGPIYRHKKPDYYT